MVSTFQEAVNEELGLEKLAFRATPKQEELVEAVMSNQYLYLAMGGGIRGTKTFGMLSVLVLLCKMFPGSRWAIVRKDLPTLRRNTVPSINKLREMGLEGEMGELNQSTWTYTWKNRSQIILFPESYSQDPEYERWKGLEVNGFLLEEASELEESSANKAIERAGSWVIPPRAFDPQFVSGIPAQPPPFVFFTFNPTPRWPKRWFWEPYKSGTLKAPWHFIPATARDNPFISQDIWKAWKNLPEEEYSRFIEGEWEFTEDPDQLIKAEWIWAARNVDPEDGKNKMGVDVARFGDDLTAICRINGNALIGIDVYSGLSIDRTSDAVAIALQDHGFPMDPKDCKVDSVGMGGGVVDNLRRDGFEVTEFVSGEAPIERPGSFYKFKNLRSQAWWELREALRRGERSLPDGLADKFVGDLTAVRYKILGDRTVVVERKEEIKKRLGRSTDYGDSYVYADFEFPPSKSRKRRGAFFVGMSEEREKRLTLANKA